MAEVIIDGCNVAECEFFEPKAQVMQCHRCAITQRCKENNCYFKQLQRLKSEFAEVLDVKCGTIAALKVENDELKAKLERIKILANGRLSLCEGCEGNLKTGWCDEPCTAYYIRKELK